MKIMASPQAIESNAVGDFITIARLLAKYRGGLDDVLHTMVRERASPRAQRIIETLAKASVDPVDLSAVSVDYRIVEQGFVESLRNVGVFDRMLADGGFRRVPMRSKVHLVTVGASGSEVAMGAPKPISKLTLSDGELALRKAVGTLVVTEELLAESAAAMALFSAEFRGTVAGATDAGFLAGIVDPGNGTHAGSSGTSFATDLGAMIELLPTGSRSKIYLVVAPDLARWLAGLSTTDGQLLYPFLSPSGGRIGEWLPVLVSDQLAARSGYLIDASQIAADSGPVAFDASQHATLQMADNPAAGPTNAVSLWQTNSRALRAERFFGFELMDPAAVVIGTALSPA